MITALSILLLGSLSLCITVGLLTVLQSLVHDNSGEDYSQDPVFQDHRTK